MQALLADNILFLTGILVFIFILVLIVAKTFVKIEEEKTKREEEKEKTKRLSIYAVSMLPNIRDKAKQSIFWLKVGNEFSGTLVYISNGYFLTNRHVVTTPKKKGRRNSLKEMTAGNDISSIIYKLKLFAQDASEDLALLKIVGSYSALPPILSFTKEPDPSGGETVVLMGYQSIITEQLEASGPVIIGYR